MVDDALELLDRCVENGRAAAGPSADNNRIQPAQKAYGRLGHALHISGDRCIAGREARLAERFQTLGSFAEHLLAPAREKDGGTLARHRLGAGKADTGPAAIDQRSSTRKPIAQLALLDEAKSAYDCGRP